MIGNRKTLSHRQKMKAAIAAISGRDVYVNAQILAHDAVKESDWVPAEQVNEQGWYWWWDGDPDWCGEVVSIMWSRCTDTYFATAGQLGWTEPQEVIAMGGWWKLIPRPIKPNVKENYPMNG